MARKAKTRKQKLKSQLATRRNGMQPHISLSQGDLQVALKKHQQGDLAGARSCYEQILVTDPEHAEALHLLGVLEHQSGKHLQAIAKIERAIQLKPEADLFRKNLASACRSAGQLEKAQRICEDLLASDAEQPILHALLGRIFEDQQKWLPAITCYRQALETQTELEERIESLVHLGDCYSRTGQREAACTCFREVLAHSPRHLIATHNLGRELQYLEQFEQAEHYYRLALQIDPNCASAWNNLGVIKQGQARFDEARDSLERALQAAPGLPDVYNNLANVLEAIGEGTNCKQLFLKAIELRPGYAEAHHSLGQIYLREENFATGWQEYRWRLKKQEHDHRHYGHTEWQGQPLDHQSLLVYSEQGIGDLVMFASCLPDVFSRARKVTLEIDSRMQSLFERSFPLARIIPRPAQDSPNRCVLAGIDCQISLADLPALFRQSADQFPRAAQFLTADPQARAKWQERFRALGSGLKVGISWFGGKNLELQARRTMPLEQWLPILQQPGIHWINLQYGPRAEDRHEIERQTGISIHDWSDSNPLYQLDDFAAKLAELDLVISIDNSTVHFAGAMGTPTWCLLNALSDWRWGSGSEESLWYSSVRLFRQQQQLDWQPVIERVADELSELTAARGISRPVPQSTPVTASILPTGRPQVPALQQAASGLKPRCAIISPVGPGHQAIYLQAERSIRDACLRGAGPFREVIPFRIDDHEGKIGRSKARNFAVKQAAKQGIEWVFFLDADDMLVPDVFLNVEQYLDQYDAIWGQIYSFADGTQRAERRENQLGQTDRFDDVLNCDPFFTLQMGHFVRTEVAIRHPFNEQMDVGEDFDYYLRVWEQHRCIKLDQPLFANRRGAHSTGPRSATGRDWTITVNRLIQEYRNKRSAGLATSRPVSRQPLAVGDIQPASTSPRATQQRQMKLAIYGMMRSGTTLLCDKLTVPGQGLILLEPNIHLEVRPDHIRRQLERFGIEISEQEWLDGTRQGCFQKFFNQRILPELQKLQYWGVKMVNFSRWQEFMAAYPADHLILCVRDIRDVILSALDLAPRLDSAVDAQWIERRALETAAALLEMAKRPHLLLRYEDFCSQPASLDLLARQLGLSKAGTERIGLEAVPHRLYEEEKHGGKVSSKSIQRYREEPSGPALDLANKVWRQCAEFCERFGYPLPEQEKTLVSVPPSPVSELKMVTTPVAPGLRTESLPLGRVLSAVTQQQEMPAPASVNTAVEQAGAGQALADFWKQDHLANIIPHNKQLGAFPEGWDVRPLLREMLDVPQGQKVLEIGCGYGRLCEAFSATSYEGVDVNPEAIEAARKQHPGYRFHTIGFEDRYPSADALLVYTVLLHIDDLTIGPMLQRMCAASPVILIAEILGRKRWRRAGNPPVFNRDLEDYIALMQDQNYQLACVENKPYLHYPQTEISFMKFVRQQATA